MASGTVEALLLAINAIHDRVGTDEDQSDFETLKNIIQSPEAKKAIEVDEVMRGLIHGDSGRPRPVDKHLIPSAVLFRSAMKRYNEPTPEIEELRQLMRSPHIQGIFFCHDRVATKDFFIPNDTPSFIDPAHPDLVSIPSDALDQLSKDTMDQLKLATNINLERTDRPLGVVLQRSESGLLIWQVLVGSDAHRSGAFHEGDELLSVSGIPLSGMSTTQAMKIMNGLAGTHVLFSVLPSNLPKVDSPVFEPYFLRAHFDYSPLHDEDLECKDVGLEFRRGDIVEVLNQDDPNWWQARIYDELSEGVTGLIPALHMQEKRMALRRTYQGEMGQGRTRKWGFKSFLPKKKKQKTYYFQDHVSGNLGIDDLLVYEDVVKLQPDPQRRRPIVIIGAPGVGRKTLIKMLIESDPDHFKTVVPHTSRAMRAGETNGKDYYFVGREHMEREIRNSHFLEHGEHKGNLYGVSIQTVLNLMKEGKVPVLDLHPQSLKLLRSSAMMPYTVFIKAPPLDRLMATRPLSPNKKAKTPSSFTEAELDELTRASQQLEVHYSSFFDWIIVNDDLGVSSDFLREMAKRIETEVQWVPTSWCTDRAI